MELSAYNPRTQELDVRKLLSPRSSWATQQNPAPIGRHVHR